MSKSLFIYLFIFSYMYSLGCANRSSNTIQPIHDTVYIAKKSNTDTELKGTTVLKASEKNMQSRWEYGLWLDEIISSECLSQSETPSPIKITSINQINDSILIITANIFANCSYSFLGEIEVVKTNTLNLIYHGYGGYASCSCCFGLSYRIQFDKSDDYKFDKLKYVTINGIAKTLLPSLK